MSKRILLIECSFVEEIDEQEWNSYGSTDEERRENILEEIVRDIGPSDFDVRELSPPIPVRP